MTSEKQYFRVKNVKSSVGFRGGSYPRVRKSFRNFYFYFCYYKPIDYGRIPPPPRIFTSSYFDKTQEQSFIQCNVNFSLNIFYLLKCAKGIRHKLNKFMKSSPIYNKLQQTYEVFSYIQ